jgi:nucleoside-diphosphate-sugar epimerase
MAKFVLNVTNKNIENIKNVKDFNLKHLEFLYLIDYCTSHKRCKVVYAKSNASMYRSNDETVKNSPLKEKHEAKDYTDILVK